MLPFHLAAGGRLREGELTVTALAEARRQHLPGTVNVQTPSQALASDRDYPIFLKVAPDLADREVEDIVGCAHASGLNGLIVGNTTISRPDGLRSPAAVETGGLSGAPLRDLSNRTLQRFHQANGAHGLALIGVGGVATGADAYAKIRAGACAVQLYTAMVFQGPGVVRRIKRDLAKRLRADGFSSVAEARGTG